MEITSIVGPVMAVAAVLGTALIKGVPLIQLIGASAACIVGLGSLAAVTVAYPLKDFLFSFKSLGVYLKGPNVDAEGLISEIERLSQMARKDGFLALEKEIDKLEDSMLRKGIRMLVDNTDPETIQSVMEDEISMMYEEEEIAEKFWEDLGAFSPTVGILGAVLGLMVVMNNLSNPDLIGPGIAAAFIATIYGVGLANLWALPVGKKLKRMCHHKKIFREMVAIGVMGIAQSHSPKILVERLRGMHLSH